MCVYIQVIYLVTQLERKEMRLICYMYTYIHIFTYILHTYSKEGKEISHTNVYIYMYIFTCILRMCAFCTTYYVSIVYTQDVPLTYPYMYIYIYIQCHMYCIYIQRDSLTYTQIIYSIIRSMCKFESAQCIIHTYVHYMCVYIFESVIYAYIYITYVYMQIFFRESALF